MEGRKEERKKKGKEEWGREGWKLDVITGTKLDGHIIFTISEGPYPFNILY